MRPVVEVRTVHLQAPLAQAACSKYSIFDNILTSFSQIPFVVSFVAWPLILTNQLSISS